MLMWRLQAGREGRSDLDRPTSNFDVAGIPTGSWSSGLFACGEDGSSCFLAFCCTPCLWSQVATRAQIPVLIDMKNYFLCTRNTSGYGWNERTNHFNNTILQISGFHWYVYFIDHSRRRFACGVYLSNGDSVCRNVMSAFVYSIHIRFLLHDGACQNSLSNEVNKFLLSMSW